MSDRKAADALMNFLQTLLQLSWEDRVSLEELLDDYVKERAGDALNREFNRGMYEYD